MAKSPENIIEEEVLDVLALERQLSEAEQELMQLDAFVKFTKLQKEVSEQSQKIWKQIETSMINNNVKSVKGDFGSITIAERLDWSTNDELPAKFYKKIVDKKKLSDTFRLEGKAPKGAEPRYSKYLTKRLK